MISTEIYRQMRTNIYHHVVDIVLSYSGKKLIFLLKF